LDRRPGSEGGCWNGFAIGATTGDFDHYETFPASCAPELMNTDSTGRPPTTTVSMLDPFRQPGF
ncbi:MAG: hypothetical protein OXF51_02015, partial [Alphaproteobacteria bacterium]|nr:hypothetical protein [Alphaproteobacteria bacterium]